MKRIILSAFFILGSVVLVSGQPTTGASRETVQQQISRENDQRQERQAQQSAGAPEMGVDNSGARSRRNEVVNKIENIYREPTAEEMRSLAPAWTDRNAFAGFLSKKHTGLIRLVPDSGCADNPYLVNASGNCLKYSMPGAGASFSFRKETYRIPGVADLTLRDGFFLTTGTLIQGIMVNIGDVPLEEVDERTNGWSYIFNFEPETDPRQAREVSRSLADGIESGGFTYQSSLPVADQNTYLMRSIAYRGKTLRSVEGFSYDEMRWDKRADVMVAFRVIRRDPDGSVTILWKRLKKQKAPKMEP